MNEAIFKTLEEQHPHLERTCGMVLKFIRAIKSDDKFKDYDDDDVFLLMLENIKQLDTSNTDMERLQIELPTIFMVAWKRYLELT